MNAPRPVPGPMGPVPPRAGRPARRRRQPVVQLVTPPPRLRCADSDRNKIVEQLQVHYVDGRLQLDEYEQRVNAALAATYVDQLPMLLAELPMVPPHRLPQPPKQPHFCADRMLLAGGLTAGVVALFAVGFTHPSATASFLLFLLSFPIIVAYGLILGLPCPRHKKKPNG